MEGRPPSHERSSLIWGSLNLGGRKFVSLFKRTMLKIRSGRTMSVQPWTD